MTGVGTWKWVPDASWDVALFSEVWSVSRGICNRLDGNDLVDNREANRQITRNTFVYRWYLRPNFPDSSSTSRWILSHQIWKFPRPGIISMSNFSKSNYCNYSQTIINSTHIDIIRSIVRSIEAIIKGNLNSVGCVSPILLAIRYTFLQEREPLS